MPTVLPDPIAPTTISTPGLDVQGTQVTNIKTVDTNLNDNVVVLNNDEKGNGITKNPPYGGFLIKRGTLPDYYMVFDENDQSIKAGPLSNLRKLVSADPANVTNALVAWDGSGVSTSAVALATPTIASLTISSGDLKINSVPMSFPLSMGPVGTTLVTDGLGNLTWGNGTASSATMLVNQSGNTKVEVERFLADNTVRLRAGGVDAVAATASSTTVNNRLILGSGFRYNRTVVTTTPYTISASDTLVVWNCITNGTVILPDNTSNAGQWLMIENITAGNQLTLALSGSDTLEGSASSTVISDQYSHIQIISDGTGNWIIA